jgi:thiosulfate/3-mercaptopyruvate sulfurtransferase
MIRSFLIEPSEVEAAMRDGALLVDTRNIDAFMRAHIKGAIPHSTHDTLLTSTSLDEMKAFVERMADQYAVIGASPDRNVVLYDDDGSRVGRELWILTYVGHQRARMLHGGLRQWIAEGRAHATGADVTTVRSRRFTASWGSQGLVTAQELHRRSSDAKLTIIDVRSDDEWNGQQGYPCCPRRGRIPNAVHIEWAKFLDNGRFRSRRAILTLLQENGVNPDVELVTYSHRGGRSANTCYVLKNAEIVGVRNFIGSWHEWSFNADLPIVMN